MQVRNVHERVLPAAPGQVRPWLDAVWSGTDDDVFPHDRLVTWRDMAGDEPAPWAPSRTCFGHATLKFQLRRWDGTRWDADVLSRSFRGTHGFALEPAGSGTRVRHVLEGSLHGAMRWRWPLAVEALHDWAVEAMFDRLEHAVSTGRAPPATARPMPAHARAAYEVLDALGGGALSGAPAGAPNNWGATPEEMRARFACDALLVPPDQRLYRAVTVRAPRARVFRWLCQMRVAPYSYDWIDNFGRRSPRELTPGLERLAPGQPVMRIFDLASFEPDRHLTLRIRSESAKRAFGDLACSYAVADAGPGGRETRLVVKLVVRYARSLRGRAMRRLLPWGDLVMMRKQLLTLKALAERDESQSEPDRAPEHRALA
jgi:hypothetical protein